MIWKGDSIIPGVPETLDMLKSMGKRLIFVTNNSTKSRAGYLKKFHSLGLTQVTAVRPHTRGPASVLRCTLLSSLQLLQHEHSSSGSTTHPPSAAAAPCAAAALASGARPATGSGRRRAACNLRGALGTAREHSSRHSAIPRVHGAASAVHGGSIFSGASEFTLLAITNSWASNFVLGMRPVDAVSPLCITRVR